MTYTTGGSRHGVLALIMDDPHKMAIMSKHVRDPNSYYIKKVDENTIQMFRTYTDELEETWNRIT